MDEIKTILIGISGVVLCIAAGVMIDTSAETRNTFLTVAGVAMLVLGGLDTWFAVTWANKK